MEPKIRLNCFSGEWDLHTIGELTSIVTGATPSTEVSSYWENGAIPWMSSGELNKKQIYNVDGRITTEGYNSCGTHLVPPFSVLIGLAGQGKTRGTAAINHIELCTNQSIAALLPNAESFNSFYLFYYLEKNYRDLRSQSTGDGGRGGLNKQILLKYEIRLPLLQEQEAIANLFLRLDSLIESSIKKVESLKQVKAASLLSMFPQEGETIPRVRFKGFDGEWRVSKLNSFLIPSTVKNRDNRFTKADVLSVSGEFGIVNQIEFQGRSFAGASVANYGVVEHKDVVYTKSPLKSNP